MRSEIGAGLRERDDGVQRCCYKELQIGVTFVHSPGRTVDDADNTAFSTMTMNMQSMHLDAHASARTEHGERLINTMFTLSTLVGLSVAQLAQGTTVTDMDFEEITFLRPVLAGDTLYTRTVVLDKRLSRSRPGKRVVRFEHTAVNQRDVVAVARRAALMRCRDGDA